MAGKKGHCGWGWLRQSGRQQPKRWHASYIGPDKARHKAEKTFGAKMDAEGCEIGAEPVPVRAVLWRQDHPTAIGTRREVSEAAHYV
jgi:hypothetical protein